MDTVRADQDEERSCNGRRPLSIEESPNRERHQHRGVSDGTLTVSADGTGAKSKLDEVEATDWKGFGDCLTFGSIHLVGQHIKLGVKVSKGNLTESKRFECKIALFTRAVCLTESRSQSCILTLLSTDVC